MKKGRTENSKKLGSKGRMEKGKTEICRKLGSKGRMEEVGRRKAERRNVGKEKVKLQKD